MNSDKALWFGRCDHQNSDPLHRPTIDDFWLRTNLDLRTALVKGLFESSLTITQQQIFVETWTISRTNDFVLLDTNWVKSSNGRYTIALCVLVSPKCRVVIKDSSRDVARIKCRAMASLKWQQAPESTHATPWPPWAVPCLSSAWRYVQWTCSIRVKATSWWNSDFAQTCWLHLDLNTWPTQLTLDSE